MAPILETAISIVFVFLVFSLINSWIVEYFSMKLQRRGKFLREFMTHYLNDKFNKNWGLMLYSHPLIEILHRDINIKTGLFSFLRNNQLTSKRRLPAYVPPNQLASALIDLIIKHDMPVAFITNEETKGIELVKNDEPVTGDTPVQRDDILFGDFLNGLDRLNESEMKTTLVSLSRKVKTDSTEKVNQLNSLIAEWFESSMDRLNGWYKRETRSWLFFTGLAIAVFFNVNTFKVVHRLYTDPNTRATITAAAEQYIKEHPEFVRDSVAEDSKTLHEKIIHLQDELSPLPIGWGTELSKFGEEGNVFTRYVIRPISLFIDNFSENWLGWLATALALSFGAPFWFDVLKKFINVRSAGLIPSTKKESKPQ